MLYTAAAINHSSVGDYFSLLKPRVMSLVVFTGLVGLVIAPGNIHPLIAFIAILCIAIGSGAAGAINMWYDRDIDAVMKRTENRAIPLGKITPEQAIEFGAVLSVASVLLMAIAVNYISAALLATAILFYVFVYTIWLKRKTTQNIVIGGAAGAFPPIIGWAAVTGNITIEPIILFLIIFFWTPPHFWALSLYRNEDYKRANIPMLPVIHGAFYTKKQILIYSIYLFLASLLPFAIGIAGITYALSAIILGVIFIKKSFILLLSNNTEGAPGLFGYSILYLFLLFSALVIDMIIRTYV